MPEASLRQAQRVITVDSRGKGLHEFTAAAQAFVRESGIAEGLLTVFVQHTSASLVIQENADPDVVQDLNDFFARIAPEDNRLYRHTVEGPDDMPAHIRAALTAVSLSVPVRQGRLALGTWQGIYLFEHRARPHRRSIVLHLVGMGA